MSTITQGQRITTRTSWDSLSDVDYAVLMGRKLGELDFGLLGTMSGAGLANNYFREPTRRNLAIRENIRTELHRLLSAPDGQFVQIARDVLAKLFSIERVGIGVATRLMTLSRPDRCISVNDGSRDGLGLITKIHWPDTKQRYPELYGGLLTWVQRFPAFQGQAPSDSFERRVWDMRTALLDVFVYEPTAR